MSVREDYDFDSLTNEAEQIVVTEIERQIPESPELCTCSECVLDVAAYALNRVRPRYRVSLLDSVFEEPEERSDYLEEIRGAVREGIRKVSTNPPHD